MNNKTYQPLQSVTVKAKEDLPAFRFISHLGSLCAEGTRAFGVTEVDWLKDQYSQVVTLGTMAIETTSVISSGDDITAGASGKAKKAGAEDIVNGRALDSTDSTGFIRIKLVP